MVSYGDRFDDDLTDGIDPALSVIGVEFSDEMFEEPEGMRISLSGARTDKQAGVGVQPRFVISGDFQITLTYELIEPPKPTSGHGSGVKIWAKIGDAPLQAAAVGHVARTSGSSAFVAVLGDAGKQSIRSKSTAAQGGRLRLVREGEKLTFLAAEQGQNDFEALYDITVRTDDVKVLRVAANQGGDGTPLNVRFTELTIQADQLIGMPPSRGGRLTALVVVLVLVGGGAGVWLWRRRQLLES